MSQFSVKSNVSEYDGLHVGAGVHGHLFSDHCGRPTTPDPALVLQYPSLVPENDGPYLKPHIYHPCNHLPHNSFPDNAQRFHVDVRPTNATACFFNAEDSFLYYHYNHLEGASMASNPLRFGPPLGRHDQLHTEATEGSSPRSCFEARMTLSRTPGAEINVRTDAFREFAPIPDDRYSIYAGEISWVVPGHNKSGDFDTFLAATVTQDSVRDNYATTTPLGMRSMCPTSPGQPPVAINSDILPTNKSSNHHSPTSPDSDHGDGQETSDFRRSASQGRQHTATVSLIASSRVSEARRNPKKYWCQACNTGFSQKQGLRRHNKDAHLSRLLCPYCEEFEWSPGRKYIFRKHLEAKHPEVALQRMRL